MKKFLFILLLPLLTYGQAPTQSYDFQIIPSDFFLEEYPNDNICSVKLANLDDVSGTFSDGQCLKFRDSDDTFIGGSCGTGGSGFNFTASAADPQHPWIFAVQQNPLSAAVNFTTGVCPSGWGTNCWSIETRAIVGSYTSVNGGIPPSDIVLLSDTRVAYSSASDKRATSVWVNGTQYKVNFIAHNGLLGTTQVVYSTFSTNLPGTNWQNVRFEFSDGTFAPATTGTAVNRTATKENLIKYLGITDFVPNQSNIYPAEKAILQAGSNIRIVPSDANNTLTISSTATGTGELVALDNIPTDLTSFINGQVLRINNPAPGTWQEVSGADAGERHIFQFEGATDPSNASDWGYSALAGGDIYGKLRTWDGGKVVTDSGIERIELQDRNPDTGVLLLAKSKVTYANAPSDIYVLFYQNNTLGSSNYVLGNIRFRKQADNALHIYTTYAVNSQDAGDVTGILSSRQYVTGIGLFTALNVPQTDYTSNAYDIHSAKSLRQIDAPDTGASIVTKLSGLSGSARLPASAVRDLPSGGGGGVTKTPRILTALPADSGSSEGERVFISANYSKTSGFDITPGNFGGSILDGLGYGNRGWYSDPEQDYDIGRLSPDDSEIADVYLISDTKVLVRTGALTTLQGIRYGSTECSLTKVSPDSGNNNIALSATDTRRIDQYDIGSGCSNSGDWDDISLKTGATTYIPASVMVQKGLYEFLNSDWQEAGYYAKGANPSLDLKFQVEEEIHGAKSDSNITFEPSGQTFTDPNPFPGILRLTYNNDSNDTDLFQRYTIFVSLTGFLDSKAPVLLQIGTTNYSVSYLQTQAGQAVYRTTKVVATDGLIARGTKNSVNIQLADGSWVGQSGAEKRLRTLEKDILQIITNSVKGVHTPPTNPFDGERIEMLNNVTLQGGAVITAEEASSGAGAGLYTGWEDSSVLTDHTELGSIDKKVLSRFLGLVSFSNARAAGNEANKTMFVFPRGQKPRNVWINGVQYTCGAIVNNQYCQVGSLDGGFIKAGHRYYVNFDNASGEKGYEDVTLDEGETYIWDGVRWTAQIRGLTQEGVDERIAAQVEDFAEVSKPCPPGVTSPCDKWSKPCWQWVGTQTELNAISSSQYISGACYNVETTQ